MEPPRREWRALVLVALFVCGCIAWTTMISVAVGIVMWWTDTAYGTPEQFAQMLGGAGFGALSIAQIGGFLVVAAALAALSDREGRLHIRPVSPLSERWRRAFPLHTAQRTQILVALLGGLTIWPLPAYLAERILEQTTGQVSNPEILVSLLVSGSVLDRVVMLLAIVISAPVIEEFVFRGFLWRVTATGFGWPGAWAMTTALFALSHFDPVQSIALLPIALFLGWSRRVSGSLLPPIAAHLANNATGVLITAFGPDEEVRMPLWAALLGLLSLLGFAALGGFVARRSSPSE